MVGKKGLCNQSIEVEKHRVDLGNNKWLRIMGEEPGKVSWVRQRVSEAQSLVFSMLALVAN